MSMNGIASAVASQDATDTKGWYAYAAKHQEALEAGEHP